METNGVEETEMDWLCWTTCYGFEIDTQAIKMDSLIQV